MNAGALTPGLAIGVAWLAWLISWLAAAMWTRRTTARPSYATEFPNRFVTLIGGVVLFVSLAWGRTIFPWSWDASETARWALFACVIAGIAFAWWARAHLGALWSGTITRKQDHRIIDTGPYALVRHPIYTGILLSLFATALESGRLEAAIGVIVLSAGLWMKARLEESFLAQDLGEAYSAYCGRVPMLIPFAKALGAASKR